MVLTILDLILIGNVVAIAELLFTCSRTRGIHVELVTSLGVTSFLLAFPRFTNLRGAVDTVFSDNDSTFCAEAEHLPSLLTSTEFHNSLGRRGINWIETPLMLRAREGVGRAS